MWFVIFINRVLNISDRLYVDLILNSVDTESRVLSDCQFFAYVIIRPYMHLVWWLFDDELTITSSHWQYIYVIQIYIYI